MLTTSCHMYIDSKTFLTTVSILRLVNMSCNPTPYRIIINAKIDQSNLIYNNLTADLTSILVTVTQCST